MKKISLVMLATFACASLFAQAPAKLGIKGGVNISDIQWSINMDKRIAPHAGLLAHIHLAPSWAIQPEVLYSAEGGKQAVTNGEVVWKNDYVNIPVMLQYMFNNGFRIEAGPQLGLLASSKVEDDDDVEGESGDVFKSTNVSVGVGLNYLSYSGLGIGARYNHGLSDISEAGWPEAKSRNFQLSLFYMFDNAHKAKSR